MFTKQTVSNCPITSGSSGRVVIPPSIIAELAGTLDTEPGLEWLILLHGRKLEGGLIYEVESFSVPSNQERHGTEVELPMQPIDKDVLGPVHSHHSMGAFFSGTDETKLNPLFDLSIVISSQLKSDEDKLLGFSYEAVGFATLPCGVDGHIEYYIVPKGIEDWPFIREHGFKRDTNFTGFGDCCQLEIKQLEASAYEQTTFTIPKCNMGLAQVTNTGPKSRVFGSGSGSITKQLPPPIKALQQWSVSASYYVPSEGRKRKRLRDSEHTYVEPATRQSCYSCGEFQDTSELLEVDDIYLCFDCFEFFSTHEEPEQTIVAGGYEELIEWDGREVDLATKHWEGHYAG